jgi:hypothetical protein
MSGQNRLVVSTLQKASESTIAKALLNADVEAKKEDKKGKKKK